MSGQGHSKDSTGRGRRRPLRVDIWAVSMLLLAAACSTSTLPEDARVRAGEGGTMAADGFTEGSGAATDATGAPLAGGGAGGGPAGATGARRGGGGTGTGTGTGGNSTGTTTGPGGGSTVGVTGDSIKIAVAGPFSGVYGTLADKTYANGYEVWQKEVNASGGIHGRKIQLVKVDNHNTAAGAVAACKEVAGNGSFMVMVELSAGSDECFEQARIPVLDLGPRFLEQSWKYVLGVGYVPAAASTEVSFLKSKYANAGGHKIGMVVSKDSVGLSGEAKAITAELKRQGMNLVHVEEIATNQASFVSEMSRMEESGAQTVLLFVGLESAGIIRDAKATGFTPQWYLGPLTSIDLVAQANSEQLRGVLGTRYVTTTEMPAFAAYVDKVAKYQGQSAARQADTLDAAAYAQSDFLGAILRGAGRNLTRESLLAAARNMEGYNNGLMGAFTLKGREWPVGVEALVPMQCCNPNYTFRSLGPPSKSF